MPPCPPPPPHTHRHHHNRPQHQAAGACGVQLAFPEADCPERLVFVVHDVERDEWIRDHSANFSLPLRSGAAGGV